MLFVYQLIQHKRKAEERPSLVETVDVALEERHRAAAKELEMTGAQALEEFVADAVEAGTAGRSA